MNICVENQTDFSDINLLNDKEVSEISVDNLNLSHPYFVYPNTPLSEYIKYEIYNEEVKRLFKYIENLKICINDNVNQDNFFCLTPIIIGSAMEQAIRSGNAEPYSYFQWQQLFPSYIKNFISAYSKQTNNTFVNLIIISPDKIFSDEFYKEPLFTHNTEYIFKKISNRKYKYFCTESNLTINVDIFNCPFPSLDSRKEFINRINDLISRRACDFSHLTIKSYKQTQDDILFINNFYKMIDELMILNNGFNTYMIINSWATFKNLEGYNGYKMFEELLKLASKNNIMATEWVFQDKIFFTQIISTFKCDYVIYGQKIRSLDKKFSLFNNIVYTIEDTDYSKLTPSYYNIRYYKIYFDGGILMYEL